MDAAGKDVSSIYISDPVSKSSASRALIEKTTERMGAFLSRRLDKLDLIALFLDGIEFASHTVIVALGVTTDGTKVPLGLWLGSTENATICTELVQSLVARGLKVDRPMLCVVDGGKGIRKALLDVLGTSAVIQRCQVHKLRNVREHLARSNERGTPLGPVTGTSVFERDEDAEDDGASWVLGSSPPSLPLRPYRGLRERGIPTSPGPWRPTYRTR